MPFTGGPDPDTETGRIRSLVVTGAAKGCLEPELIHLDDAGIVVGTVGRPAAGNRNSCKAWKMSGATDVVGRATVIAAAIGAPACSSRTTAGVAGTVEPTRGLGTRNTTPPTARSAPASRLPAPRARPSRRRAPASSSSRPSCAGSSAGTWTGTPRRGRRAAFRGGEWAACRRTSFDRARRRARRAVDETVRAERAKRHKGDAAHHNEEPSES